MVMLCSVLVQGENVLQQTKLKIQTQENGNLFVKDKCFKWT